MAHDESLRVPAYWQQACRELANADPVMGALVRQYRGLSLVSRGEPFVTLLRAIVGQQISVKAADTVWGRVCAAVGTVSPAIVAGASVHALAGCGLSRRKVEYALALAGAFLDGSLQPDGWPAMDDAAIIAELTRVHGIGRWTAEMFLIFTLLRPDVLPVDDVGLQRAVGMAYFNADRAALAQLRELGERWSPWCSVATWHLWRSLDPVPVEY